MNFAAEVDVARLEDTGRFMADVRVKCADCGVRMLFTGLPRGLDIHGAAMSVDASEARLAIMPDGSDSPISDGVRGFTITPKE